MQTMIDNLINGNLKDAKKQAKHKTLYAIYQYMLDLGYTKNKALASAAYLKEELDYQAYCDAE